MSGGASRRRVLTSSAAVLLAPAVAPAAVAAPAPGGDPDSRLLELRIVVHEASARYEALLTLWGRAHDAGDDEAAALHDERARDAWDAREAGLFALAEVPATSLLGLAAKAEFAHGIEDSDGTEAELQLMRSLSADAARILGGAASAPPAPCPDAELVAACSAYAAAIQRYNAEGGHLRREACPLWAAVEEARARALAAPEPRTLAGIRAQAELCRVMAHREADGALDCSDSYCGHWPGWVVEDVLRLLPEPPA